MKVLLIINWESGKFKYITREREAVKWDDPNASRIYWRTEKYAKGEPAAIPVEVYHQVYKQHGACKFLACNCKGWLFTNNCHHLDVIRKACKKRIRSRDK